MKPEPVEEKVEKPDIKANSSKSKLLKERMHAMKKEIRDMNREDKSQNLYNLVEAQRKDKKIVDSELS